MLKEFRPTVLFLVKFFAIYFAFSILYGLYISKYDTAIPPQTDPITRFVTYNCTAAASLLGYNTHVVPNHHLRTADVSGVTYDSIWLNNIYAISVEEGCNGINIMILFVAFVVAFNGGWLNMLWYIPAGVVFIHVANIGRLLLLGLLNVEWAGQAFHFFHKYGFTAIIYLAVLLLWYLWVIKFRKTTKKKDRS